MFSIYRLHLFEIIHHKTNSNVNCKQSASFFEVGFLPVLREPVCVVVLYSAEWFVWETYVINILLCQQYLDSISCHADNNAIGLIILHLERHLHIILHKQPYEHNIYLFSLSLFSTLLLFYIKIVLGNTL